MRSRNDNIEVIKVTSGRYQGKWYICRGNKYLGPNGEWSISITSDDFYRDTEQAAEEARKQAESAQEPVPPP